MARVYKNYERPAEFKQPPWFIKRVQLAIEEAVSNPKLGFLKSLNLVNKNNPNRQKRLERRKGIESVTHIMWDGVDIETGVYGKPNLKKQYKQDYYIKGLDDLSEKSGRTQQNVKRILSDMYRAGYMTAEAKSGVDHEGNTVRYFTLRKFTTKFLAEIGIKPWELEAAKHRKRKQKENQPMPYAENPVTMMMRVMNGHPNSPSKIHARREATKAPIENSIQGLAKSKSVNKPLDAEQSNLLRWSNDQMMNLYSSGIPSSEFSPFFKKINDEIRAGISLYNKQQEIINYCKSALSRQRIN